MITRSFCTAAAIALALVLTPSAEAAKKNKRGKRGELAAATVLGRFDRDSSGTLEEKESAWVRKLFGTLKKLDSDNNGELSDSEIAAVKPEKAKRKGGKRKKSGG